MIPVLNSELLPLILTGSGIAVFIAIIGGGARFDKITLPHLPGWARVSAATIGILLFAWVFFSLWVLNGPVHPWWNPIHNGTDGGSTVEGGKAKLTDAQKRSIAEQKKEAEEAKARAEEERIKREEEKRRKELIAKHNCCVCTYSKIHVTKHLPELDGYHWIKGDKTVCRSLCAKKIDVKIYTENAWDLSPSKAQCMDTPLPKA